jgi:hypothetical protein
LIDLEVVDFSIGQVDSGGLISWKCDDYPNHQPIDRFPRGWLVNQWLPLTGKAVAQWSDPSQVHPALGLDEEDPFTREATAPKPAPDENDLLPLHDL